MAVSQGGLRSGRALHVYRTCTNTCAACCSNTSSYIQRWRSQSRRTTRVICQENPCTQQLQMQRAAQPCNLQLWQASLNPNPAQVVRSLGRCRGVSSSQQLHRKERRRPRSLAPRALSQAPQGDGCHSLPSTSATSSGPDDSLAASNARALHSLGINAEVIKQKAPELWQQDIGAWVEFFSSAGRPHACASSEEPSLLPSLQLDAADMPMMAS